MPQVKEVVSSVDVKEFVQFPFELYKTNENWIPPIKKEEYKMLIPDSNPAYKFCDA